MPDGEVSGTINVEVIYKEAGGAGVSASDVTGGGAASGSAAAAATKKNNLMFAEMAKFAKITAGAVTVGAVIKQSKVMSGMLGAILQLLGALVDIFLSFFMPLLIPLIKGFASVVKWFARFMDDPMAAVKEALTALGSLIKDLVTGFFEGFPTSFSDLADLFGKIDFGGIFETVLKLAVGGLGLVALFATLTAPFAALKLALTVASTTVTTLFGVAGLLARTMPSFFNYLKNLKIPGLGGGSGVGLGVAGGGDVPPVGAITGLGTLTTTLAVTGLAMGAIIGEFYLVAKLLGKGATPSEIYKRGLLEMSQQDKDFIATMMSQLSREDQTAFKQSFTSETTGKLLESWGIDAAKRTSTNPNIVISPDTQIHITVEQGEDGFIGITKVDAAYAQTIIDRELTEFHRFDGEG